MGSEMCIRDSLYHFGLLFHCTCTTKCYDIAVTHPPSRLGSFPRLSMAFFPFEFPFSAFVPFSDFGCDIRPTARPCLPQGPCAIFITLSTSLVLFMAVSLSPRWEPTFIDACSSCVPPIWSSSPLLAKGLTLTRTV